MPVLELSMTDAGDAGLAESDAQRLVTADQDPVEMSDAEFGRLFSQGALFGVPVLYAVLAGVSWVAAPGHLALLAAVLWPAVLAGWYFGGIVAMGVSDVRPARGRRPAAQPRVWAPGPPTAAGGRRLVAH